MDKNSNVARSKKIDPFDRAKEIRDRIDEIDAEREQLWREYIAIFPAGQVDESDIKWAQSDVSSRPNTTDAANEVFQVMHSGLAYASVCTNLSLNEATRRLNLECATGVSSEWRPSSDPTFQTGQTNPCDCEQKPGFKHYLFDC